MPSRSEMDTPAMVTALILGIVLIAASVPFLGGGGGGGKEYTITWTEVPSAQGQAASGAGSGSSANVNVAVTDIHPATAVVSFEPCTDGAMAPLSQPASIAWTVFEGDETKGQGTASCANKGPFEVVLEERPDVATADGADPEDAEAAAYEAADGNETVTFRLVFSWTRGGGLPVGPQPAFSTTGKLEIQEWRATANDPDQEVPR